MKSCFHAEVATDSSKHLELAMFAGLSASIYVHTSDEICHRKEYTLIILGYVSDISWRTGDTCFHS